MAEHLIYLLCLHQQAETGLLVVEPCLVQILKSGKYSKPIPLIGNSGYQQQLSIEDDDILQQLKQFAEQLPLELPAEKFPLLGQAGNDLLTELIATGRAHWVNPNSPPLKLGIPRKAQIEWLPEGQGLQRLHCRVPGKANTILALIPLWYVDHNQHCCGLLETELDANVIALLLTCPPLPAERLEQVIKDLSQPDKPPFIEYVIALLQQAGWPSKNTNPTYLADIADDWYMKIAPQQANNRWFDMELGVTIAGEQVNILPILIELIHNNPLALKSEQPLFARLPNGHTVAVPKQRLQTILSILTELYDENSLTKKQLLPVSHANARQLIQLEQALGTHHLQWLGNERLRDLGQRLQNFQGVAAVPTPTGLQTSLRAYQQEGLNWLQFLRSYDLAGVLADDMGLGKTIQTLAHLLVEQEAGRMDLPSLLVVPTSLVSNWQLEAQRFAPSLKILALHGNKRQQHLANIASYDLVITTYPLLVRDQHLLLEQAYHYVILDESHYIKNPRAKASRSAQQINGRHRLCLTGTPLENNLSELWSLFNFLLPGFLGKLKQFRHTFQLPIEKNADSAKREALIQRIKPFLLRRTKQEVLTELPPKTEIRLPVEMEDEQRDLYESIRISVQQKVMQAIGDKGLERSHFTVLEALLRLRQVCCDPRLVKIKTAKEKNIPSAKLDLLIEMLLNLVVEGRRVIVFSQFAQMLDLIAKELQSQQLAYVILTGKTQERASVIDSFQSGQVPIFLLSLKAGGIGLNLTAADTIIHYDPWWNPAVEKQATDRAHRIGQDKPIFVYKLVAKGTVEEKIIALQNRKQALLDDLLTGAGKTTLTPSDLEALFAPLETP